MAKAAEPPSGTRDFLADDVRRRKAAFDTVAGVFEHYGFDPLETPAFERLEVFQGKLGEEASALIFKILKRGVHEATGRSGPGAALRPHGPVGEGRRHVRQPAAVAVQAVCDRSGVAGRPSREGSVP